MARGPEAHGVFIAERELAGWIAAHQGVPKVEVHVDVDATWMTYPGSAWSNCATGLRFSEGGVRGRLDEILDRYRENGRGAGFWVSSFATPETLTSELARRGLRCRRHFPVMLLDLEAGPALELQHTDLEVSLVDDHDLFSEHPHPYFGRISTPNRRFELARLRVLVTTQPQHVGELVGTHQGIPVTTATVFIDDGVAGFHDVGTTETYRGQGFATALMSAAAAFARDRGAHTGVLLSTSDGQGLYRKVGFTQPGTIAYWYRSYQRG